MDANQDPTRTSSAREVKPVIVDEEGLCPTCGYFAGSLLSCPRCGARVEKRISIKLVKVVSVVGSILGVALLWIAASLKQPKQINVASLDERMNGAYIRVVGKLVSYIEDTQKNTLKMQIDDGTGKIGVNAFNKLSQFKKIHQDHLPELGDTVEVAGSVSETQKFGVALFLPVPERFRILQKLQAKHYPLGDITDDLVGDFVQIRVYVSSYEKRATKKGAALHAFVLSDATGNIPMVIFDSAMDKVPPEIKNLLFEKNAELEIPVQISDFRGFLQASVLQFSKIRKVGTVDIERMKENLHVKKEQETKKNRFKNLKKKNVGESFVFRANVRSLRKLSKGTALTLNDGTGDMPVVIWDTIKDKVRGIKNLEEGAIVSGIFEVGEFRDDLQLKVSQGEDIRVEKNRAQEELQIIAEEATPPEGSDELQIISEDKTETSSNESSTQQLEEDGSLRINLDNDSDQ